MYEQIIERKDELIEAYEKAEEAGDKQRMTEIYEEIKEINDFMATEFFLNSIPSPPGHAERKRGDFNSLHVLYRV